MATPEFSSPAEFREVMDAIFSMAGASGLYDEHPIQRAFREVAAISRASLSARFRS